ncbi:MAG: type II toxin-antitoxin system VapC family toxin [Candidatus Jordarchaeales archaeon]
MMLIESDVLYAYVKADDWLKPVARKLIKMIEEGCFGEVYASREVLHELYYVSVNEGVSLDELISRTASLVNIKNLVFLETDATTDLLAFTLMRQYGLTSLFDAYYAATTLSKVQDRTIVSTDKVFDKIPVIRRVDPRGLVGGGKE